MANCTSMPMSFPSCRRRVVEADFSGGSITSNGGVLLLRQADRVANLIKDVLGNTLREDAELQSELAAQYNAFKENLIHDITPEDFADIYAETIAYGMFAARLHDQTLNTFSRQEALELLPKSNPFLRSLFTYVAGYDLDDLFKQLIGEARDRREG